MFQWKPQNLLGRDADGVEERIDVTQLELEYAVNVRKLLFITEFMLLINYVEVIVPIIFCKFSTIRTIDSARLCNIHD